MSTTRTIRIEGSGNQRTIVRPVGTVGPAGAPGTPGSMTGPGSATAGTIIPSIAIAFAAAAVVEQSSGIEIYRLGPTGSNTQGTWT